jgi:hypothetical protein
MVLMYLVNTPLAEFNMQIQVHGVGANIPDIRKWFVKGARIRSADNSQNPNWTDLGRQQNLYAEAARRTFQEFAGDIGPRRDFNAAYSKTADAPPKPVEGTPEYAEWLKKRDAYFHMESPKHPSPPARVVRLEPLDFWSNGDMKNPFVDAVDLSFSTSTKGPPNPTWLVPVKDAQPVVVDRGDHLELRLDCRIMLVPAFLGQSVAILKAPKDKADQAAGWKLVGIDVLSARPLPVPPELRNAPPELLDKTLRGN